MLGNLESWLNVPVVVERPGGRNQEGDPIGPYVFKLKCYVEARTQMITSRSGQRYLSTSTVYFTGTDYDKLDYDMKLTLPGMPAVKAELINISTDRFGRVQLVRVYL